MSFVYPLFLLAGLSLVIPILIHLFNLRRYKTVLFPHTRFLKNIQLKSKKQNQLRHRWLLAARLLLLSLLILAFAQPFFNNTVTQQQGNRLQIIYLDNSHSMGLRKGARRLIDVAKDLAAQQVKATTPGSRFALITSDGQSNSFAEPADKTLQRINEVEIANATKTATQVWAMAENVMRNEGSAAGDLFYYSDFQEYTFENRPAIATSKQLAFYGVPVQTAGQGNVFIDTAYLSLPVLQTNQNNQLIVRTTASGTLPDEPLVLQLSVNGQVKSAASLSYNGGSTRIDTLNFQVTDASWQKIQLMLNDPSVQFDDTFRVGARSAANLSVLVLNEGQFNPYIQAAFRAYNGFRLNQADATVPPADWTSYNLVIVNGVTTIGEQLGKAIDEALQRGQSVCIMPGRTANLAGLNSGLRLLGDIQIENIDTSVQTATSLQQGSGLVKDLFERIPENVQLPVANWHYTITAGLSANQQSILSFRNGSPLFARYTPSRGQLYICATAADLQSGNFPGSYFFAPFLYQMAVQSSSSNIFAITAGSQQPIYLPLLNATQRSTVHLVGNNTDVVPPQRANGGGIDVFPDQSVKQAGFYALATGEGDTTVIGLNVDGTESALKYTDLAKLKSTWNGPNINWPDVTQGRNLKDASVNNFPLWKICVLLALVMLGAETLLLLRNERATKMA